MIIIKPDEIANICAIYHVLKVKKLLLSDLSSYITSSLSIDSFSNSSIILREAFNLGILELKDEYCWITSIGSKLTNYHSNLMPIISESTKEYMLKNIYLKLDNNKYQVDRYFSKFYPDTEYNTFVCKRNEFASSVDIKHTLIFQRLGLIYYRDDKILINPIYIGFINDLLLKIRKIKNKDFIESPYKTIIGDIAEEIALVYEKHRLIDSGHPELANLVQIISKIDYSAGYDIISFLGRGKDFINPIYIEVKGTEKNYVFFYWTKNEQTVATMKKENYYLYIYTNVDRDRNQAKGPIIICDPINYLDKTGYIIEPQDLIVKEK